MAPPNDDVPATEIIYLNYEGNFQMECSAKVLSVEPVEEDQLQVCLDCTVLHAQGGGQPTDYGQLVAGDRSWGVEKVEIDRATGIVTHFSKAKDTSDNGENLRVGDQVTVQVDQERRRLLSECHTAGHVVDSAMGRCGKTFRPTKGYHFLDGPYVEYKGTVPPEERDAFVQDLQKAFAELVKEDIGTKIETLSIDEAEAVCNRVAHNFDVEVFAGKDKTVRVVTVAGFPCPCGGTHVKSTGLLKARKWGITGLRCKKGIVRVRYNSNVTGDGVLE